MKTLYRITKTEVDKEVIERDRLFNVFVFGLPRSGTSMMTHICELLGVKMIHTTEEKRADYDKRYKEKFGEYHPNPNGFFEIAESPLEHFFEIAGTPYSGCKMIIPVMGTRWELIKMLPSKVIMMVRNPDEIKDSQEAFYSRETDLAYLRTALVTQAVNLRECGIDHIQVNYSDVINDPVTQISRVREFIGSTEPINTAVEFVQPDLYRHRVSA